MKIKRVMAFVFATVLVGVLVYFYVGFKGNPISMMLANQSAKEYIEKTYPNNDYEVGKSVYNFKFGEYVVRVKSKENIDESFHLSFNWKGDLNYDSYEDDVDHHWNTYVRLLGEYGALVDQVMCAEDFPVTFDNTRTFGFGTLHEIGDVPVDRYGQPYYETFGFNVSELESNKEYDIKELGKTSGLLVVHINDEKGQADCKVVASKLREIKAYMDQMDIPFYAITLTYYNENRSYGVLAFRNSNMSDDDLEEQVQKQYDSLYDYYHSTEKD